MKQQLHVFGKCKATMRHDEEDYLTLPLVGVEGMSTLVLPGES